jgi:catechol 1,2-dioxygenase
MAVTEAGQTTNTRVQEIFDDVIDALRDVIVRHRVSWDEYRVATDWLTMAGNQGYEIPLLMDIFLSTTVDDLNFPANGGTESNVEGPFYIPDAPMLTAPYVLPRRQSEPGEKLVFSGTVRSVDGSPLPGAVVDVWQANGAGEYSHFHPDVPEYNLRGRLLADAEGRFEFETVTPDSYEIPKAGATGQLMAALGRPCFRPSHIHFKVTHKSARPLTTQVYFAADPWLHSDVVGAMKDSLVTTLIRNGRSGAACTFDFVLTPAG